MTEAEAREAIERYVAADSAPALTNDEVDALVRMAVREPLWVPGGWYSSGYLVADSGLRYVATFGGTSGEDVPTWPEFGATVTDGTVVWELAGEATYDLHGAAAIGWEWKAARVAGAYDVSLQGSSFSRSQMYAKCIQQAQYHRAQASGGLVALGTSGYSTITIPPPTTRATLTDRGVRITPGRIDPAWTRRLSATYTGEDE